MTEQTPTDFLLFIIDSESGEQLRLAFVDVTGRFVRKPTLAELRQAILTEEAHLRLKQR